MLEYSLINCFAGHIMVVKKHILVIDTMLVSLVVYDLPGRAAGHKNDWYG